MVLYKNFVQNLLNKQILMGYNSLSMESWTQLTALVVMILYRKSDNQLALHVHSRTVYELLY